MNKTQTIYTVLWWIVVVLLSYIVIMQPKVKAGNEILEIQQEIQDTKASIQEHKDRWQVALDSRAECIESWDNEMDKENRWADADRAKLQELEERLGLLMQR